MDQSRACRGQDRTQATVYEQQGECVMEWQDISTAPKDEMVPVLVAFDHDADPCQDPSDPRRLTDYSTHAESGDYLSGRGVAIAIWRDSWEENEGWESGIRYTMPAAWWNYVDGDAGDHVVNAIAWMPLPAPPAIKAKGVEG